MVEVRLERSGQGAESWIGTACVVDAVEWEHRSCVDSGDADRDKDVIARGYFFFWGVFV